MVKRTDETVKPGKSQLDKFKETAKQVETDNSEGRFDQVLGRVANVKKPSKNKKAV